MSQRMRLLSLLFVACFVVFLGYRLLANKQVTTDAETGAAPAVAATNAMNTAVASMSAVSSPASNATVTFASIEQARQAANGDDAALRVAAIEALANFPNAKALPVLREVLQSSGPEDQQLAMQTLRDMALDRGDADGDIRDVLREAIYHVNDTDIAAAAQTTLDDVEGALSQVAAK